MVNVNDNLIYQIQANINALKASNFIKQLQLNIIRVKFEVTLI